jgi:hypothetical protein
MYPLFREGKPASDFPGFNLSTWLNSPIPQVPVTQKFRSILALLLGLLENAQILEDLGEPKTLVTPETCILCPEANVHDSDLPTADKCLAHVQVVDTMWSSG